MRQTTFSKEENSKKEWFLVDAEGATLGRVASRIAHKLLGKDKTTFTTHWNNGDKVIVINADKIKLSGKKRTDKSFYWHTGYAGGIKSRTMEQILESKFPERVFEKAVERMLGKGPLGRAQMKNLMVYAGSEHPHVGQAPVVWDLKSEHKMNTR